MKVEVPPAAASPDFGSGYESLPVVEWLSARPGVQKVPNPKLTLFIKRDFLSPVLCTMLMALIDARRRPSTVSDWNGDDAYRTSETCDFVRGDLAAEQVNRLITAFLGLDPLFGEPLQGQRYSVGQEFKAHTDYFEPTGVDYEKYCSVSGQRTWTAMVYLNEPVSGGATRFKAVDKMVHPEPGKLLIWNNLRPDGSPNPSTIHHGMKVRAGTKYVLTKWYRQRHWG